MTKNLSLLFLFQFLLLTSWVHAGKDLDPVQCREVFKKFLVSEPKYLPEYIVKKYNVPKIVSFDFTPESLNKLSDYYHNLEIPDFLWQHSLGNYRPGTVYLKRTDDRRFVFAINDPYYDFNYLQKLKDEGRLKELKDSKKGLVFLSWFNHPNVPKEKTPGALNIKNIEKEGPKFLASLLDLKQSDLPSLRLMQENAKKALKDDFGVTDVDKVQMYFHFPYMKDTIGLHLHIRVNHPAHDLEFGKSFFLSDTIAYLEKNSDIRGLILERQQMRGGTIMNPGGVSQTLKELGVPVKEVPNPFYDPTIRSIPEETPLQN
jgi:hypothetical protein